MRIHQCKWALSQPPEPGSAAGYQRGMRTQRFKLTLSSDARRNQLATEVMDQGGIDYEILRAPAGAATADSLPKVEADGMALSSFDPPALRRFLVAHGAHFEDS